MKVFSQLEKAQLENTTSDTGSLPKGMITYRTDLNISKVSDGTNMLALIDESTAQTISNKTYASPITTGAIQGAQIATPANPSAGNNKLYFKSDGKLYTLDSSGNEAAVGSGSGGVKNLITNGNADDTASSIFVPYADAAGTRPVDGTGGSPTVTTSVSTSSPLDGVKSFLLTKPASNVQGQGWAVPFSVDPAYRAKSLKISADFIVNSGTFVAGSNGSSPTDGDLIWYIYDVTNSLLIEPSNIKMFSNSSTVADKFEATFQSSASGSSYRLIAHVASTSALAFELKVDNITVSPQANVFATPINDFSTSNVTSDTIGLNVTITGQERRVGDSLEVFARMDFTGANTQGGVQFKFPNYQFDFTKLSSTQRQAVGTWIYRAASAVVYSGNVYASSAAIGVNAVELAGINTSTNTPVAISSGDQISIHITVPIVGWSSSTKSSDGYDGRLIASSVHVINTVSIPNVTFQKVNFESKNYDYTNSLDLTNDRFTAPSSGLYRVSGYVNMAVGTGIRAVTLYKNGSGIATLNATVGVSGSGFSGALPFAHEIELVAGDYLEIFAYQDSGGSSNIVGNFDINFSKIQSPQAVVESETVACKYYSSGGVNHPDATATLIPFDNKTFDTHNAFDTATGKFTAPVAGFYQVNSTITFTGGTSNGRRGIFILKNGGADSFGTFFGAGGSTNGQAPHASDIFYLKAGEFIQIQGFQDSGGALTTTNDAAGNFISIARIK